MAEEIKRRNPLDMLYEIVGDLWPKDYVPPVAKEEPVKPAEESKHKNAQTAAPAAVPAVREFQREVQDFTDGFFTASGQRGAEQRTQHQQSQQSRNSSFNRHRSPSFPVLFPFILLLKRFRQDFRLRVGLAVLPDGAHVPGVVGLSGVILDALSQGSFRQE